MVVQITQEILVTNGLDLKMSTKSSGSVSTANSKRAPNVFFENCSVSRSELLEFGFIAFKTEPHVTDRFHSATQIQVNCKPKLRWRQYRNFGRGGGGVAGTSSSRQFQRRLACLVWPEASVRLILKCSKFDAKTISVFDRFDNGCKTHTHRPMRWLVFGTYNKRPLASS